MIYVLALGASDFVGEGVHPFFAGASAGVPVPATLLAVVVVGWLGFKGGVGWGKLILGS